MAEWSASIILDGVDVSSRVVGRIDVEAEESTSRVASFNIIPLSGLIQVGDWINAPVTIDHIDDPNGSPTTERLFTGNVNKAIFDPVSGFVAFECTDNLQGHFEAMAEAQILTAITDGRYSIDVFGEREDGWQQAQDVLSTVEKGYDLNRDGSTPALTDWAAKSTPDFSYNASTVVDQSVEVDLIRLRDIINKVIISAQYRFTRLHHREHSFSWDARIGLNGGFDFCDYFADSYELPTRDMIQSAGSAGWAIKNDFINFETLPVTGSYNCGGTVGWSISDELLNQLVVDADWTVVRKWSQTITEDYTITIQEGGSINKNGELIYEDGAGWQTDFDDGGYDASTETDIPDGFTVNAIGDYTQDQLDRTRSDNSLLTLMQIGKARICQTHRQNFISWDVALEPTIERSDTAFISYQTVTAQGKVFQYVHAMNVDEGTATTNIKIAVSNTWEGGGDIPLTVPPEPDSEPTHSAPSSGTLLDNRIGNDITAPVFDEDWTGFTGNFTVAQGGIPSEEQIYPRRFRVVTDDIEDESRNEVQVTQSITYDIKCPDETLILTVGLAPGESIVISEGSALGSWVGVGAQTLEGVFSATGSVTKFFQGVAVQVVTTDWSSTASATVSGVGQFNQDGVGSSTGVTTTDFEGSDGVKNTDFSASGVSVNSFVSAAVISSSVSIEGSAIVSGDTSTDSASFSITGAATTSGVSNTQTFYEMVSALTVRVNHWRLGESSGTTASDDEGTDDLTYNNTPTLGVTGPFTNDSDTAVSFDSFNNEDASLSISNYRSSDSSGCIMAWLKYTGSETARIFSSGDAASVNWVIAVSANTSGALSFFLKKASSSDQNILTSITTGLDDNDWHFVVVQSDSNDYEMYIDGEPTTFSVDDGADDGDWFADVFNRDQISVGSLRRSTVIYGDSTIDEVVILEDTLTAQEVKDLWNAGIWT